MSFLKEFKEDLSQAVNELVAEEPAKENTTTMDDEMVNTLDDEMMTDLDLDTISDLLDTQEEPEEKELKEELENIIPEEKIERVEEEPSVPEPKEIPEAAEVDEIPTVSDTDIPSDEVAEITKGTSITGNINSDGSINVYGRIVGDVNCKGKMIITGSVKGTSSAGEIFANSSKIEGDIRSTGSVKIGNGSVIIGNVYATSAVIGGAVKGDIDVHGPVIVDATAVIQGNIKSRSVQINNGAAIEGFCSQCYADVDYKSLFDDTFK